MPGPKIPLAPCCLKNYTVFSTEHDEKYIYHIYHCIKNYTVFIITLCDCVANTTNTLFCPFECRKRAKLIRVYISRARISLETTCHEVEIQYESSHTNSRPPCN